MFSSPNFFIIIIQILCMIFLFRIFNESLDTLNQIRKWRWHTSLWKKWKKRTRWKYSKKASFRFNNNIPSQTCCWLSNENPQYSKTLEDPKNKTDWFSHFSHFLIYCSSNISSWFLWSFLLGERQTQHALFEISSLRQRLMLSLEMF